ncbi:VRR-NUC domain-containing protein [Brucella anthropi]|uniref:VRR-NUC domain-containing protein n=1 Tax=Brucella anthropi TaxID=529 RepID=UPI002447AD4D|nr:VRR-NUC domain-containing protein [Brucella anthropi]MDH0369020.1 VRR-NUC domain-containing protein [Brucella anthropi]
MARSRTRAPSSTTTTVTKTQTVRINGARVKITTKAGKVTTKPALPLEWELQAAQITSLRRLSQYQRQFLLAGDMNASKRGPRAQAQAIATGMTSGEPDLRIYGEYGRLLLIENKVGQGKLSPAQKDRHGALQRLGYTVLVIRATTTTEAAEQAVMAVLGWLAETPASKAA